MSSDTILAFKAIIDSAWLLATGWKLPGVNMTPAQLGMFMLVLPLIVWFVRNILTVSISNAGFLDSNKKDK